MNYGQPLPEALYYTHMTPTATKIKNRTITLPEEVGKEWFDRDITVFADGDRRLIIEPVDESEWERFEKLAEKGKDNISLELIDEAVAWAKKSA